MQVTGSNAGTWGTDLNVNDITITDSILGTTQALTLGSGTLAITTTQSQNLGFALTGALSGNCILTLPFNLATSGTTAVGGNFVFSNLTSGAYTVTVKTVAAGSTGVTVPQGLRALLYSNGTNVYYANDGGRSLASSVLGYAGSPDGVVTCTPASSTTPADMLWDYTNDILYVCTAAPNTWSQAIPPAVTVIPTPVTGYLTLSSDVINPILTNDSVAATTIYWTPYTGDVVGIPNGTTFSTYVYSQLTLALNSTYQVANGIYDVFAFVNSGNATIGFGPIWTTGGGSVTAGSCARGTGANSTQISRLLGTLVNTVAMTLNNGATTYSISPRCGTYLGTVWIDSTAAQVTCHKSWGQSRKWGVWNCYNRVPLSLKAGDSTASWTYNSATIRASNGDSNNNLTVLCGLAEEVISAVFNEYSVYRNDAFAGTSSSQTWVGYNSTSVGSGTAGVFGGGTIGESSSSNALAQYTAPPSLGINTVYCLEGSNTDGTTTHYGTEANMLLTGSWRG